MRQIWRELTEIIELELLLRELRFEDRWDALRWADEAVSEEIERAEAE